ncbi:hypothetical protein EVAR_224_1 [Eumeta japonica]|uniref:Nesprin-1 n=1 Tax=Eumeta variegata TaxID=151549 RepID=A0A4C1S8Z0_EUMVA|nr:hypothetical protein EVAR_224_1 [Eumeta japonica]
MYAAAILPTDAFGAVKGVRYSPPAHDSARHVFSLNIPLKSFVASPRLSVARSSRRGTSGERKHVKLAMHQKNSRSLMSPYKHKNVKYKIRSGAQISSPRLRQTLAARLAEIDEIVSDFDHVSEKIDQLRQQIEVCIAKVKTFYVFGEDDAEGGVRDLGVEVSELVERTKTFTEESRKRYGGSAPADVAQELSALELSSEALAAAMEEKEREWKRARTTRTEYAADVEEVQAWIRASELTARDRTLPPQPYRERLVATRADIPAISDRMERLQRNARAIVEGSRDASERQLVQSTVTALADQFAAVCSELEARQAAVEDACDAVARFLALLEKVLLWVETQRAFLARPLPLADLQEAQQKQTEYGNALKSCKQQSKNLADMAKELEAIERVTSPGDLPSRLEMAENATIDVEKRLAKTNGLLQELSEEWERCEKKLKDVGHWLEATTKTIETPQNAKKPLRDRLAIREKIITDISVQKTKISYAVEKLNVHFGPDGVAAQSRGPEGVEAAARELNSSLDNLGAQTSAQAKHLEAALSQVEAYCADVARLRAQLLEVEQQLRQAAQPNYSPRDPDRAQRQQQESPPSDAARRIEELTRAIYELDPYFVMAPPERPPPADPTDESIVALSMMVSTADRARLNRRPRSPERRVRKRPSSPKSGPELRVKEMSTLSVPNKTHRAPSPVWTLGGTTYAEIVKGHNSRSSSIGSRQSSVQRQPQYMSVARSGSPIEDIIDPVSKSDDYSVSVSGVQVPLYEQSTDSHTYEQSVLYETCDLTSYEIASEIEMPISRDIETYFQTDIRPEDEQTTYIEQSQILRNKPCQDSKPEYRERDLSSDSTSRTRTQDLSYAEILALGLRKRNVGCSILQEEIPKQKVSSDEMPTTFTHKTDAFLDTTKRNKLSEKESKPTKIIETYKPVHSEVHSGAKMRKTIEKEKNTAIDTQTYKKKKLPKRPIEVQDFNWDVETTQVEVRVEPVKQIETKVHYKKSESSEPPNNTNTVIRSSTICKEDEVDSKKKEQPKVIKKKGKTKKQKLEEDEIDKALKEIEATEKHKRKQKHIAEISNKILSASECNIPQKDAEESIILPQTLAIEIKDTNIKVSDINDNRENKDIEENKINKKKHKSKKKRHLASETSELLKNREVSNISTEPESNYIESINTQTIKESHELTENSNQEKILSEDLLKKTEEEISSCNMQKDFNKDLMNMDWNVLIAEEELTGKDSIDVTLERLSENVNIASETLILEQIQSRVETPQVIIDNNSTAQDTNVEDEKTIMSTDFNAANLIKYQPLESQSSMETNITTAMHQDENTKFSKVAPEVPKTFKENVDDINNMKSQTKADPEILNLETLEATEVLEGDKLQDKNIIQSIEYVDKDRAGNAIVEIDEKTVSDISQDFIKNEQNNNETKLATKETLEQPIFNVFEEVTVYKPAMEDIKTHTIYLITHEEKKLPPIRKVKISNNKSVNETFIQDENTENSITSKEDSKESAILEMHVEEEFSPTEISVFGDSVPTDICREKMDNTCQGQDTITKIDATILQSTISSGVGEKIDFVEEIPRFMDSTENDEILEPVIFGSVKDRQKLDIKNDVIQLPLKEIKTLPNQEIIDEVKIYSLELDQNQLEYDLYMLSKKKNEFDDLEFDTQITDVSKDFTHELVNTPNYVQSSQDDTTLFAQHRSNDQQCTNTETIFDSTLIPNRPIDCIFEQNTIATQKNDLVQEINSKKIVSDINKTLSDQPLYNYHELVDAEKRLAYISKPKISSINIEITTTDVIKPKQDNVRQKVDETSSTELTGTLITENSLNNITSCEQIQSDNQNLKHADKLIPSNSNLEQSRIKPDVFAVDNTKSDKSSLIQKSQEIPSTMLPDIGIVENIPENKMSSELCEQFRYISQKEISTEQLLSSNAESQHSVTANDLPATTITNAEISGCTPKLNETSYIQLKETVNEDKMSINELNTAVFEQSPWNYQEFNDAEMILASTIKPESLDKRNLDDTDITKLVQNELVQETKKILQNDLTDSTFKKNTEISTILSEQPRYNYQELSNAESFLARINSLTPNFVNRSMENIEIEQGKIIHEAEANSFPEINETVSKEPRKIIQEAEGKPFPETNEAVEKEQRKIIKEAVEKSFPKNNKAIDKEQKKTVEATEGKPFPEANEQVDKERKLTDKMCIALFEAPRYNHQELIDAEILLAANNSFKPNFVAQNVLKENLTKFGQDKSLLKEKGIVCKDDRKEITENTSAVNSLLFEQPRYNPQELLDAEVLLASMQPLQFHSEKYNITENNKLEYQPIAVETYDTVETNTNAKDKDGEKLTNQKILDSLNVDDDTTSSLHDPQKRLVDKNFDIQTENIEEPGNYGKQKLETEAVSENTPLEIEISVVPKCIVESKETSETRENNAEKSLLSAREEQTHILSSEETTANIPQQNLLRETKTELCSDLGIPMQQVENNSEDNLELLTKVDNLDESFVSMVFGDISDEPCCVQHEKPEMQIDTQAQNISTLSIETVFPSTLYVESQDLSKDVTDSTLKVANRDKLFPDFHTQISETDMEYETKIKTDLDIADVESRVSDKEETEEVTDIKSESLIVTKPQEESLYVFSVESIQPSTVIQDANVPLECENNSQKLNSNSTSEISDLNESLVPLVFGKLDDIIMQDENMKLETQQDIRNEVQESLKPNVSEELVSDLEFDIQHSNQNTELPKDEQLISCESENEMKATDMPSQESIEDEFVWVEKIDEFVDDTTQNVALLRDDFNSKSESLTSKTSFHVVPEDIKQDLSSESSDIKSLSEQLTTDHSTSVHLEIGTPVVIAMQDSNNEKR